MTADRRVEVKTTTPLSLLAGPSGVWRTPLRGWICGSAAFRVTGTVTGIRARIDWGDCRIVSLQALHAGQVIAAWSAQPVQASWDRPQESGVGDCRAVPNAHSGL